MFDRPGMRESLNAAKFAREFFPTTCAPCRERLPEFVDYARTSGSSMIFRSFPIVAQCSRYSSSMMMPSAFW